MKTLTKIILFPLIGPLLTSKNTLPIDCTISLAELDGGKGGIINVWEPLFRISFASK